MCDSRKVVHGSYKGYNIGILTSGGDSQGMNAAIKAVVRIGIYLGCKVFYIKEGYQGMIDGGDKIVEADWASVCGIHLKGGTIIGSTKCMDFMKVSGRIKAAKNLIDHEINRLIIIGGDGSFTGANQFQTEWERILDSLLCCGQITKEQASAHQHLSVAGIAGSIDNDFCDTDMTIGTDTALHRIMEAIAIIKSTAYSHRRTFIMEVMGRNCGYLGLCAAISAGADFVFYPENPASESWPEELCNGLLNKRKDGARLHIIVVSEGAIDIHGNQITSEQICKIIKDTLKYDTRVTVLGHLQRGGAPSAFDRYLGIRMGTEAVLAVLDDLQKACVITMAGRKTKRLPLLPFVEKTQAVGAARANKDWETVQKLRGASFISKIGVYEILRSFTDKDADAALPAYNFGLMHIGAVAGGFNTCLRIIGRYCLSKGCKLFTVYDGIDGLINDQITEAFWNDTIPWTATGCILGSSRTLPSANYEKIATSLKKYQINGLFVVGGFNAFMALLQFLEARKLHEEFCIPIIMVPATISNNIPGTDITISSDTAINEVIKIMDGVKITSDGNQKRLFVMETMGSNCGYLATMTALVGGSEAVYIREEPFTIANLYDDIVQMNHKIASGVNRGVILRNEKACNYYTSDFMQRLYSKEAKGSFSTRINIIGHVQQGCTPTPFDRKLATRFSMKAFEWMLAQSHACFNCGKVYTNSEDTVTVVGQVNGRYKITPLSELKEQADIENQLPIQQWWLNLLPLFRILNEHPNKYEPGKYYEEVLI